MKPIDLHSTYWIVFHIDFVFLSRLEKVASVRRSQVFSALAEVRAVLAVQLGVVAAAVGAEVAVVVVLVAYSGRVHTAVVPTAETPSRALLANRRNANHRQKRRLM